jgi:hypothetical protein
MKSTLIAIGLLATASLALPAFARGGLHLLDPAWNPQHISGLPAEVRNALAHMCRDPQAEHQFARYFQDPCLAFRNTFAVVMLMRFAHRRAAYIRFTPRQVAATSCSRGRLTD